MEPFILVRHATPLRDGSLPPAEWHLDPQDLGAIAELASVLRSLGLVELVTSSERKAVQTGEELARLVGLPMVSDSRLNEVHRPFLEDDGDFTDHVKSYLNGGVVAGWERQDIVIERMRSVVEDASSRGFVGLVTHGTAMSLFLEHLRLVQAWQFWGGLANPDGWLIEGPELRRLIT
jgi:broad specificity phosphatase PhoE